MGLSSNSIIHFTSKKATLKKILEEGFKMKYCMETVQLVDNEKASFGVPMISFCDIPLAQIKDHIGKYGKYGIGLTKEWAIRKGLNPVVYLQQNSDLAKSVMKTIINLEDLEEDESLRLSHVVNILRYAKNYQGDLKRADSSRSVKDYRFADEKEWRYVDPVGTKSGARYIIAPNEINDKKIIAEANGLIDSLRIGFEPEDIKYIIIKNESEIHEFISALKQSKGRRYPAFEVERLTVQ